MPISDATPPSPITLVLGESQNVTPLTPQMQQSLAAALAGGPATASFFTSQAAIRNFYEWLALEPSPAWIQSTDSSRNICYYAAQISGDQTIALIVSALPASADEANGTFDVNGQTYSQVGTVSARLENTGTPLWEVTTPVGALAHAASMVVEEFAGHYALEVLQKTCGALWQAIRNSPNIYDADNPEGDIGDGIVDVAEGAGGEEAVSWGSVLISTGALVGIIALFSVPIVLDLIAHESSQSVQIFNLTSLKVTWSLAYVDHGELSLQPVNADGSDNFTITSNANGTYGFAQLGFSSSSELAGIAYVLIFDLVDETGASAGQASVMFDVPFTGQNSLAVTTSTVNAESWCSAQQGANNVTVLTASGSGFSITVTFDYLDGEHPSPSGANSYWYNSLIAIQPIA